MTRLAKRSSIERCVCDLSERLTREYGALASYTRAQIDGVIRAWGMRIAYAAYAYALFCTREEFARLDPQTRLRRDYDALRADVLREYPQLRSLEIHDIAAFARKDRVAILGELARSASRQASSPTGAMPEAAGEVWIALAYLVPLAGTSILDGAGGVFCHVAGIALDGAGFARQVAQAARIRGFHSRELHELAPMSLREQTSGLSRALREMTSRVAVDRELQFEFFVYEPA